MSLSRALLVVALVVVASITPASFASATTNGTITTTSGTIQTLDYTDSGTLGTITGCASTCAGTLVIPSSDGTNPIAGLEASAFLNMTGITSVTIPSSVTIMGSSVFEGDTSLTSIAIPSSVTFIGASAFQGDTSLSSVTIPSSVTSLGNYLFEGDTSLTSIAIPSSVTYIGLETFDTTGLTSVTIPSSVTSLGGYDFAEDPLTSVTIPSSVTTMNGGEFRDDTHLQSATILNSVVSDSEFEGDTSLSPVTIPSSVTSLGASAFSEDTSFTSVTIPSSVTSLGANVFTAAGLTSVTIPSSVTSLGGAEFYEDASLTSVTIQNAATSASEFEDDTSLTSVSIGSNIGSIDNLAFYDDTSLASITIPSSVTSLGTNAFEYCPFTAVHFLGNAPTFASTTSTFSGTGHYYYPAGATGWNATIASDMLPLTPVLPTDAYSYTTAGGSTAPASGSGNDGTTITLASAPTKSGYTFGGWNDGTTTYAAGATYTLASSGGAIVFTAQWTGLSSSPQYVMDYFSYSDPSLLVVPQNGIGIDNTPITLAIAPVRSGYTFTGWNDGTKTYAAGAKYVLASEGNPILFTAVWALNTKPTPPSAPAIIRFVGTKHGLVTTFSPSDNLATSFLCRISNGHNVFVRASTMNQSPSQTSYVCTFGSLYAPRRYRVWVTAINQYGSSPFSSTTAVTHH